MFEGWGIDDIENHIEVLKEVYPDDVSRVEDAERELLKRRLEQQEKALEALERRIWEQQMKEMMG